MGKIKPITVEDDGSLSIHLMKHQENVAKSNKRISGLVGGRGSGKTIMLSVLAFLEIMKGKKVMLMAQNFRSLKLNLMREVVERFREAKLTPTVSYGDMSIKFGDGEMYGFTYESIDSTRGMTEVSLLLLDEMAYAPADLLSVVAPCLRGAGGSFIRFGTTPKKGSVWNKFFKDQSDDREIFTAKMIDNTTLSSEDIELQEKAVKDPELYRQEILGEVLDDDIEFAVIRTMDYPLVKKIPSGNRRLGFDAAGPGADSSVFTVVDDSSILDRVKIQVADTYELFNTARDLVEKWNVKIVNGDATGGYASGVLDMLRNAYGMRLIVNGVNFAQAAKDNDRFANARCEMYFNLAEKIREGFYVDVDDEVREDVMYLSYNTNNSGKCILAPKKDIKELLGRSPDSADSLALALYNPDGHVIPLAESVNIAMKFVNF